MHLIGPRTRTLQPGTSLVDSAEIGRCSVAVIVRLPSVNSSLSIRCLEGEEDLIKMNGETNKFSVLFHPLPLLDLLLVGGIQDTVVEYSQLIVR